MIALLAILLLLLIPAVMFIVQLKRQRTQYLWLLAMLGALLAWMGIYFARSDLSQVVAPFNWQPEIFFPLSPILVIDFTSWVFALALTTQLVAVMLTSVARLGGTRTPVLETSQPSEEEEAPPVIPAVNPQRTNWRAWASHLALTSLGLVAVLAGNLLTLLLAWVALDIVELFILLGQVSTSEHRAKVMVSFSARLAGIVMLLLGGIFMWSQGRELDFSSITQPANLFFFLAAGLRLGILPLHIPFLPELPMRIGLGTIVRLVPVSASLVLLVRCTEVGIPGITGLVLLGLCALAGLAGGIGWLRAQDELSGRPYWIMVCSSLAMAAAIQGQPEACIAWSLAAILLGNLIFLTSVRRRYLAPILLVGAICLTSLPFTPTWAGSSVFQPMVATTNLLGQVIAVLIGLIFFICHGLLIAGYLLHGLRGILIPNSAESQQIDRWVWLLYTPGLVILLISLLMLGWQIHPMPDQVTLIMWVEGACALGMGVGVLYLTLRQLAPARLSHIFEESRIWLSIGQIYRPFYLLLSWLYRLFSQQIRGISFVLEGDAGILWALVLLVLLLVFLQQ